MNLILLIGILGSIFSIIGFFISQKLKSNKIGISIISLCIVILTSIVVNQNSKLSRISKVSNKADVLSEKREMEYTHEGYIQACLAFLEENKDLYPDAYKRALELYEEYKKADLYNKNEVSIAYELDGLIKGIGNLNSEKKQ